MSDPLPVIPLEYAADPAGNTPRLRKWLRFLAHAAWLTCILAWLLILYPTVESVLVSGPLIFLLGAALLIVAWRVGSPRHMILGASHCAICLLFFMLVQQLKWGPGAARTPFAVMGGAYAAAAAAATLWVQSRAAGRAGIIGRG